MVCRHCVDRLARQQLLHLGFVFDMLFSSKLLYASLFDFYSFHLRPATKLLLSSLPLFGKQGFQPVHDLR